MKKGVVSALKRIRIWIIQTEASMVLKKYQPVVIAITGSVGKTSAKDAIYTALKDYLSVRKNTKSFNGELGTPLAILGITNGENTIKQWLKNFAKGFSLIFLSHAYPDYLVLEVGLGRPNEIKEISAWLKPDIVVITRLSRTPVHVEFFKTVQDLINEKAYLAKATKPQGTLILNADDLDVVDFKKYSPAKNVFYGTGENAEIKARDYQIMYDLSTSAPIGIQFTVDADGKEFPVHIKNSIGRQHIYPILAALSVGYALDIPIEMMIAALSAHTTPPGRMRLLEGINKSTIIDDTYNASPIAYVEALNALKDTKTKSQKIAVMGAMGELGPHAEQAHMDAGKHASEVADFIVVVNEDGKLYLKSAIQNGFDKNNTKHFNNSNEAKDFVRSLIKKNDIILVKGSQNLGRMERIVENIMAYPELKKDLLVRQDAYWKKQ